MPPKMNMDEEIKKDQNFQEIKVIHEYDPDDLQDMSIDEGNQKLETEASSVKDEKVEETENNFVKHENMNETHRM